MYKFREFYVRDDMIDSLQRYLTEGIRPGLFLQKVICHKSLQDICEVADDENLRNLPAYAAYLYNEVPSGCHGSEERMESWINKELYFRLYNRNSK